MYIDRYGVDIDFVVSPFFLFPPCQVWCGHGFHGLHRAQGSEGKELWLLLGRCKRREVLGRALSLKRERERESSTVAKSLAKHSS